MVEEKDKVHKSLRVPKELDNRVSAFRKPNEKDASLYRRVIEAGCDAMAANTETNRDNSHSEQAQHEERTQTNTETNTTANTSGSNVEELRDHIETLKQANAYLMEQLSVKDAQIAEANRLADQAQKLTGRAQELHAMSAEPKALEEATVTTKEEREVKRSWWRRLWE